MKNSMWAAYLLDFCDFLGNVISEDVIHNYLKTIN